MKTVEEQMQEDHGFDALALAMAANNRPAVLAIIDRVVNEAYRHGEKDGEREGYEAGERDGIKAERAECLALLNKCRKVYERDMHRANARDRGADPDFHPSVDADEMFSKMTAIEYAIMVVEEWRDSEHYRADHMPMPF